MTWWQLLADEWRVERGRRRVREVVHPLTARHVRDLVPEQRDSADPAWWEFVPKQRDGGAS